MSELTKKFSTRTVQDIANLYIHGHLNLSPGFQRDSVWKLRNRQQLIESILRKFPIPAVFLYRRQSDDGNICYDVIDGKQRIESLLLFMGLKRGGRFEISTQLPETQDRERLDWRILSRSHRQHLITGYDLPTIEVDGDLADIIDLFVRINSTGKALTSAEKRHAKYYNSEFLRECARIAEHYAPYFRDEKIVSAGQISRMKHIELICEVMVSLHQGDIINKKAALDGVMKPKSLTPTQIRSARTRTTLAINRLRKMFPELRKTRFSKISDYYSLLLVIAKFEEEGMILTDGRRNKLAWDLLVAFSTGVDEVRELQKKAKGIKPEQQPYREYLLTVQQATDEISQRRKRDKILRDLLQSLFERKDEKRLFSEEQRRILWNTTVSRKCAKCGRLLTWSDFTVDHIDPFSRGGKTKLENAALMHRACNSSKGNRR